MPLPLEGIRVLDFSSYIAGPYCPALLGDLGAEVIKIEAHRGDQTRYFPSTLKDETRMFLGVNRNKKGIVLDLKQAAGREIVYKLACLPSTRASFIAPSQAMGRAGHYESALGLTRCSRP